MVTTGKYLDKKTGNFVEFKYKNNISTVDIQNFATKVSKIIVNDTDREYYSALRDLVFDLTLINEFSDIDISDLISSDNQFDAIEEYVGSNTVANEIRIGLGPDVISKLDNAVDDSIAYKTGIVKNKLAEEFAVFLRDLRIFMSNANMEDIPSYVDLANAIKEYSQDKED